MAEGKLEIGDLEDEEEEPAEASAPLRACLRKWAVGVSNFATCSGGPWATSWPPCLPASGPRSRIQSADLMTSRLCSMTRSEWPESTSFWKTANKFSISEKCSPVVGSSRMSSLCAFDFGFAGSADERSWQSLRRWDSPPERVLSGWPSF